MDTRSAPCTRTPRRSGADSPGTRSRRSLAPGFRSRRQRRGEAVLDGLVERAQVVAHDLPTPPWASRARKPASPRRRATASLRGARGGRAHARAQARSDDKRRDMFEHRAGRARASTAPSPTLGGGRTRAGPQGRARNGGGNKTPSRAVEVAAAAVHRVAVREAVRQDATRNRRRPETRGLSARYRAAPTPFPNPPNWPRGELARRNWPRGESWRRSGDDSARGQREPAAPNRFLLTLSVKREAPVSRGVQSRAERANDRLGQRQLHSHKSVQAMMSAMRCPLGGKARDEANGGLCAQKGTHGS